MVNATTISLLIPEILLVVTALGIFLGGAFVSGRTVWSWAGMAGLLLAGGHLLYGNLPADGGYGPVGADDFGLWIRGGAVVVGLLFVLMAARGGDGGPSAETVGAMLLVIAGLMLVSCARELIILFLALELISIPTYLLLYLGRSKGGRDQEDRQNAGLGELGRHEALGSYGAPGSYEATSKYFFLSVLSSAVLLYGFSFLYGLTGHLHFDAIAKSLADGGTSGPLPVLALLLVMAGIGFKIAAVPFHFYAPDVYQGTTNLNAGLLSVVPKIAGMVVLVRLVAAVLPSDLAQVGWQLCLVLSVMTMTLGNVAALWQNNVRRLLAYSSIAHAGYMLIGLCVFLAARSVDGRVAPEEHLAGLASLLLYLAVYVTATLGTFAAIIHLGRADEPIDRVEQLTGLGKSRPLVAAALAVFMFSLAGIPPLAGFWGKLGLFYSALSVEAVTDLTVAGIPMRTALIALAVIGALNAAIAAGYYLRIVSTMYFRSTTSASPTLDLSNARRTPGAAFVMGVCMLLVVALGCRPGWLVQKSQNAARAALHAPHASETAAETSSQAVRR